MAETSGFFQGMWDDSLMNPITEEYTGWWDRRYIAKQFMEYFSLFVGNGVFVSPTNQLQVVPGAGRTVIVSPGWAFINGGWYHNDSELLVEIAANNSSTNRVDSIRVRLSESDRKISIIVVNGATGVVRGDTIWDLEIAQIITTSGFTTVTASNIADMRPDEDVCGFVKGLMEVISTKDLFSQFQGIFEEWFNAVKDQVTGDLAIQLQLEFEALNKSVEEYKASADKAVDESKQLVQDYVEKDFVIDKQALVFEDNVCMIMDERVTADTLVDVYFTSETIDVAAKSNIYVDSYDGYIQLTAELMPTGNIEAIIRVRVR